MPRIEQALVRDGSPLVDFAADLRLLREKVGTPSYREMGRTAHYSATTLSEAAGGRKLPSRAVTLAFVRACGGDEAEWERRWHAVAAELNGKSAIIALAEDITGAPYVGLRAFGPDDASLFFGRARLVTEIIGKLDRHRLVLLFGASGSGKSSVMRAGVVPALTTAGQTVLVFTPGAHPIERCAVRLASLLGMTAGVVMDELRRDDRGLHRLVSQVVGGRDSGGNDAAMVFVIDQFEEVFALCDDEEERARFIAALTTAASTPDSRCRVLLGVRSDFFAHCSAHPALLGAMPDGQVVAGPMSAEELCQAVLAPARQMNCTVESALVANLIAQAYGRPGVLPLLSHVLLQVWARRSGNRLTVTGFQAAGGLDGALSRTAEDVFTGLDEAQQQLARALFGRLVALGEGTQDTRRRLDVTELGDDPDLAVVVEAFTAARLFTRDQDGVEITHEALIRAWPRLHGWLHDDRERLHLHRQLTDATDAWESAGRDAGTLYRGTRLALARDLSRLTARERDFIEASITVENAEQTSVRRRTRRMRYLVATLAALLVITGVATVRAVIAEHTVTQQRNDALSQKAAAAAVEVWPVNPALAAQLSLAAYRLAPTPQARDSLLSTTATTVDGRSDQLTNALFTPGGTRLVTAGKDRTIREWDLTGVPTQQAVMETKHTGTMLSIAMSDDGTKIATANSDHTVQLWNRQTATKTLTLTGHTEPVWSVDFSPDGRVVATGSWDDTVKLWDATTGAELSTLTGFSLNVKPVAFSADGRLLAAGSDDTTVRLWDVSDPRNPVFLRVLKGHTNYVVTAAFSPDSSLLATGSDDRTVRLWDVKTGASTTLSGHTNVVYSVAFHPDGQVLASAGSDRTVRLWDLASHTEHNMLTAHGGTVNSVAFGPDGQITTASADRFFRIWDLDIGHAETLACQAQPWITRTEWEKYLPEIDYQPPCAS